MEENQRQRLDALQTKIIYYGVVLDVFLPFILAIIAYTIKSRRSEITANLPLNVLLCCLLIVSAGDLLICFFMKRKMFSEISSNKGEQGPNPQIEEIIFKYAILIFSLCLASSIYGFVYFLLGGTLEKYVLFVVITMVGYQFFKPRDRDFRKAFTNQNSD